MNRTIETRIRALALAVICAAWLPGPQLDGVGAEEGGDPLLLAIRSARIFGPRKPCRLFPVERSGFVPQAKTPPTVDGTIGEDEWKEAGLFCGFSASAQFAASTTVARTCRDDANLYLALRCALPGGAGELSASRTRDLGVWQDESVEIFVDPGRTKKHYFQFIVNTLGTQQDSEGWEGKWNAQWQAKTRVEKDFWEVEAAIPFAAMGGAPKEGDTWGLNLNRNDKRSGEHSSWSHLEGSAHDPQRFGAVTFGPQPELEAMAEGGRASGLEGSWISVALVNRGAQAVKGSLSAAVTGEGAPKVKPSQVEAPGGGAARRRFELRLPPSGSGAIAVSWEPEGGGGQKAGDRLAWELVRYRALKLRACEDESWLSENALGAYIRTELDGIESLSLELWIERAGEGKAIRSSRATKLPGSECRLALAVSGLDPGRYVVRARLIGPDGKTVGEDAANFVRSRGPFD